MSALAAGAQACVASAAAQSGNVRLAAAPVPPPPSDYRAMEREVLEELNRARTDPHGYADILESTLKYYKGDLFRRPEDVSALQTSEGPDAVREAIRVLRKTDPLPPLELSAGMSLGARDHVKDIGPRGLLDHRGSDGTMAWDRVSRYGKWKTRISENMSFGPATARDVVSALLVDDGVADRGHRHSALDPDIRVAGVSCGPHRSYRVVCVVVHAVGFSEKGVASSDGR